MLLGIRVEEAGQRNSVREPALLASREYPAIFCRTPGIVFSADGPEEIERCNHAPRGGRAAIGRFPLVPKLCGLFPVLAGRCEGPPGQLGVALSKNFVGQRLNRCCVKVQPRNVLRWSDHVVIVSENPVRVGTHGVPGHPIAAAEPVSQQPRQAPGRFLRQALLQRRITMADVQLAYHVEHGVNGGSGAIDTLAKIGRIVPSAIDYLLLPVVSPLHVPVTHTVYADVEATPLAALE